MKRCIVVSSVLACLLAAASVGSADDKSLAEQLDELLPGMGVEKIADRRNSQQKWQDICFKAGAPGNEALRAEACDAMIERIGPETAAPARVWLIRQLERIGRDESVDALAAALDDKDPHVRDGARRALANNPAAAANAKLLARLADTKDSQFKAGLLNALGYRADPASVSAVAKELSSGDELVAAAAARALGKIATTEAAQALAAARSKAQGEVRFRITDSYLLCADNLLKQGKRAEATAIYAQLNKPDEPQNIRLAAVQGLLKATGQQ